MTTLYNCPVRNRNDYPDAIWEDDPKKYPYVREGRFFAASPRFIPVKKNQKCWLSTNEITKRSPMKLIGYVRVKEGCNNYTGVFWYLKGYDVGMPDGHYGYDEGPWKEHGIIPSEGVTFCPIEEHRSLRDDIPDEEKERWKMESKVKT